ncbi:MAG: hypothetical protein QM813_27250 [Verrucomicrobiota bacterium]
MRTTPNPAVAQNPQGNRGGTLTAFAGGSGGGKLGKGAEFSGAFIVGAAVIKDQLTVVLSLRNLAGRFGSQVEFPRCLSRRFRC